MPIRDLLLPEFDQEMANTRKMLAQIPDDRFSFQPHQKSFNTTKLSGHIADMPSWIAHVINHDLLELSSSEYKSFEPTTQKELLEAFDKNVAESRAALANVTDDQLNKTWTMKWDGQAVVNGPRIGIIRGMVLNHIVHHRAQLGVYLRLMNIAVPGMYGPSADEAQQSSTQKEAKEKVA